jgi:LysM repeat protein
MFVIAPITVFARSHGGKMVLLPELSSIQNSQTMALLDGYTNPNPVGVGGGILAVVDNNAIEHNGEDVSIFSDLGKSGTGRISVYIVRSGDTLSQIAQMFGVSANTIVWANDIKSGKIREGQELVILPITGVRHTVKSGDTLESVAKKYKASLEDILSYNDLTTSSKLAIGDEVIVPSGEVAPPQLSRPGLTTKPSSTISSSIQVLSDYFIRPIIGGRKSQGIHGYNAVDLAVSFGTPIVASAQGIVSVSRTGGYNGGYGTYIVVNHSNGTQTVYGHMDKNYVSVGQAILQGEIIGTVGMTGRTTGPHLHFEVRGARNPF